MYVKTRARAYFSYLILAGPAIVSGPFAALAAPQYQAAPARSAPSKLAIHAVPESLALGDNASLQVTLLNHLNNPAPAEYKFRIEIQCVNPNTKAVAARQLVEIPAGQSTGRIDWRPGEVGLWTLKVHDVESKLLDGSTYLLVRQANPKRSRKAYWEPAPSQLPTSRLFQLAAYHPPSPEPEYVPQGGGGAPQASSRGRLLLVASTRDLDGFLADGKDSADIHVFYEGGGEGAPTDVYVYLRWSSGALAPTPLVIKKGSQSAVASLTSTAPGAAKVDFVNSNPAYDVDGETSFTIPFVQPLSGIALIGPTSLSLVDSQPLMARFLDMNRVPVQTDVERQVIFTSKTANLHLAPDKLTAKKGASNAQTMLMPLSTGTAEIDAYIPGYQAVSYTLHVSATTVIVLWVVGGILGAVCAYGKLKGSMVWRVITGLVAAGLVSWAWVYGALPQIDAQLAHNTLNVLFVSVIGGYAGIAVLDLFAKKLGLTS